MKLTERMIVFTRPAEYGYTIYIYIILNTILYNNPPSGLKGCVCGGIAGRRIYFNPWPTK